MSEKRGQKIEETPIVMVLESEDVNELATIIERFKKMNEKMDKIIKETLDYQLEIAKLKDLVKEKDVLIVELRQELKQKTRKIERLESKLSAIQMITDDQQLPNAFMEQLRVTSGLGMKKIGKIFCNKKKSWFGSEQTTEQQQLEEDGLKPELKAVINEGQMMKQTIQQKVEQKKEEEEPK